MSGISLSFMLFVIVVAVAVVSLLRKGWDRLRFDAELRQWHAQNPDPAKWETPPPTRPPRSGWQTAGTVLAGITAVGGLAILAAAVLLFVALSNMKFGNK